MGKNGGARPGAGRKPGKRNTLSKKVKDEVQARVEALIGEGLTPLELLVKVYRDDTVDLPIRVKAASDAAIYVHRKQPQDMNIDAQHTYVGEELILVHEAKE